MPVLSLEARLDFISATFYSCVYCIWSEVYLKSVKFLLILSMHCTHKHLLMGSPYTGKCAPCTWLVKIAFKTFPTLKQDCTSFTGPIVWWKPLSRPFTHINRLPRASHDLNSGENILDLSWHMIGLPQWWKLANKQACTSLAGPPQWFNPFTRSFLAHKQACTSFTGPILWLKRLCLTFNTHKQAFTSLTRLQKWLKLLSRSFLAHKQACTMLAGPPHWWKPLSRPFLAHKQACTNFTGPILWLKRLCHTFHAHKHACTTLTGHQKWKLLSRSFLAHKQACTSFTWPMLWLKRLCQNFHAQK